ncbi:5-methylcytosine-specific restriction endonuclease McrA [Paenibacillus anaericanus]|uniref:HNH endonuclease n=1 Tax=Paenibacillus anaericanus TaxID=170367 RepID=UPI002789C24D|nr:HNH endonuclease domain-containing protein [Paenibacillus anaericanus]MDQ0087602.1 5-methylcytosine-specific restriction endonuclease McrA [Paenibacillus anaericanus]
MNFIEKWLYIIRNCSFDNTYKMSWAKAITEIACECEFEEQNGNSIEITLESIAHKVIRYYWEQTIFFDLMQSSNINKPPVILSIVKELISSYQTNTGSVKPSKWYTASVENICGVTYQKAIKDIVRILKQDVSYRFLRINGKEIEGIYEYIQKSDYLMIPVQNLKQLKEHSMILFDTINYRWTQMLENFNHSPRLSKKVRIIDEDQVRRKPLGKFNEYLDSENPHKNCFLCGLKIENETPAIDHVIPWSYLYSDDLWNLVFAHQSCNSSKSNIIPSEKMINRLEKRNIRMLQTLNDQGKKDKHISELKMAIEHNLLRKFWISCQG